MNWASIACGAAVISVSSEVPGCESLHVLTEDLSQIWLSDTGLPQWICISLQSIPNYQNVKIRTVGWHCWHSYSTNPREVRIHVSRDGAKFRIWDTISAAAQHQGTQLFCCAPISVALYPFFAFEILTTYGGPQTYMNRIYLYSDELSSDSVASASDYERSSLNITMGIDGFRTADSSTINDDEGHDPPPLHTFIPNNVSIELLDPSQSVRHNSRHMPSSIKQSSTAPEDPELRDDYTAVLQSYDAYSNSIRSLTEGTTALVDRLSKAFGIEETQSLPQRVTPVASALHSGAENTPATAFPAGTIVSDSVFVSKPRDGGISPRSSQDQRMFRSPTTDIIPKTRLWQSDTLSQQQKEDSYSTTNLVYPHSFTSQFPETSQQRIESLLGSHDGQMYYSARKTAGGAVPASMYDITALTAASTFLPASTQDSMLKAPQAHVDSTLLSTTGQSGEREMRPSTDSNAIHVLASTNKKVLKLSSEDIDHRLRSLEDKFQTIVGLLETSNRKESESGPAPAIITETTERRPRSRQESRRNAERRNYSLSKSRDCGYRHRHSSHSRSRSPSRPSSRRHSSCSHNRRDRSSRSHSPSGRSKYVSAMGNNNNESRRRHRHHFVSISSSRDHTELHSLTSVQSETLQNPHAGGSGNSSSHNNSSNRSYAGDEVPHNYRPRSAEDVSVQSVSSSTGWSSKGYMSAISDTFSASTSNSSMLHRMLNKRDGESVEQLVQRILDEAKQNGRLSEQAAASLNRQSLSSSVTSGLHHKTNTNDLLPAAKIALAAASKAVASSAGAFSPKPTILPTSFHPFLDHRNIIDEAAQTVQRLQERRSPFPIRDEGISSRGRSQLLSTKLIPFEDRAKEISQGLRLQRSSSPLKLAQVSADEHLAVHIDQLVKSLHHCVLQRTMKEAKLRLLRGEDLASVGFQ